jgi:apolipoprotein D and lipocalin family protein
MPATGTSWQLFRHQLPAPRQADRCVHRPPQVLRRTHRILYAEGYVVSGTGNAVWRESPFWPLYLSYLILYVDPQYQTALVSYPGRGYGWAFSRTPVIDDARHQFLLGRLKDQGYDISRFRRVPQTPAQIGNPGFQESAISASTSRHKRSMCGRPASARLGRDPVPVRYSYGRLRRNDRDPGCPSYGRDAGDYGRFDRFPSCGWPSAIDRPCDAVRLPFVGRSASDRLLA